jgi:3-oxocholest-4-en-26-oyl-CoA dehydrogenase beta subunit
MDFTFDDEQQAIADLSGRILGDLVTPTILRDIEAGGGELVATDAWSELARADLLGIALPAAAGGGGYGMLGAGLVLDQIGRTAAPVPYLASIVMGAMTVADFGSPAQRSDLLPAAMAGTTILTAALAESGSGLVPDRPATAARPAGLDGDGWRLDGEKWFVPWLWPRPAEPASDGPIVPPQRVLVPARRPDGSVLVALVDPALDGVSIDPLDVTSGWPEANLALDGVVVGDDQVLVGDGVDITRVMVDRATAGLCSTQAGVSEAALRLTATYTSERRQFDAPIATFQAVAQRAADAYIDAQAIRFTAWQAAWRLDQGLPAADELDIAKFWAAEGGRRVAEAAQHLHGGIGVDTDYPLHRYYRLAKHLELTLGGATAHLLALGARMASS